MNLIEQLGGYERAKRIEKNIYGTGGRLIRYPNKDFDYNDDSGSVCDVELISFKANDLKKSLLEYRRQHNIFEVGDKVVSINSAFIEYQGVLNIDFIDKFNLMLSDGCKGFEVNAICGWSKIIRHATDLEIKAGVRA